MVTSNAKDKVVFVVHGRNEAARKSLFEFLRAIGLAPTEWSQAIARTGKGTPYVGQILDVAFDQAQAIVVLFTGDDEARLRAELIREGDPEYEKALTPQARPNVLFEAGMALGRCPDRTVLVELGALRPFSDIAGRHVVRMSNSIEARQALAQRLTTAGCTVDTTGTDWHKEGDFEAAILSDKTVCGKSQSTASSVGPAPLKILEFLAGLEGGAVTTPDLTAELRIPHLLVQHHLDELVEQSLVFRRGFAGAASEYGLKKEGRALLVSLRRVCAQTPHSGLDSDAGPRGSASDLVVRDSAARIREATGVRELRPREEDLGIVRLPNGVFGFTVPWMFNTDPSGVVGGTGLDRISLHKAAGGTAVMEVHKSSSGENFVLVYVSEETLIRLQDQSRTVALDATLFFAPYEGNSHPVAIPTGRITMWQVRSPSGIGSIADARIQ